MSVAKVPLKVLESFVLYSLVTLVMVNGSWPVVDLRMLGALLKHAALKVDTEAAHMVRHCYHHIQQHLAHVHFLGFGFLTSQRMFEGRQLEMEYPLGPALGCFEMRLEALLVPLAQLVP